MTTFSGEFTTEDINAALHKAIDEGTFEINKPFAKVEAGAQLVSGGVSDKGIVHGYNTPHGGIEFIPDDIFQALKKHLLVEGVISAKDLIKSIEPELAAIFAEGKADNVADAITYFLNK